MRLDHLFSPINIQSMELKNRIVMAAMHLGYTPEGVVTDRLLDFYVERARGGVGLIIVGGCRIDETGAGARMIGIHDDRFLPGLERLVSTVKAEGTAIACQLFHGNTVKCGVSI